MSTVLSHAALCHDAGLTLPGLGSLLGDLGGAGTSNAGAAGWLEPSAGSGASLGGAASNAVWEGAGGAVDVANVFSEDHDVDSLASGGGYTGMSPSSPNSHAPPLAAPHRSLTARLLLPLLPSSF